MITLTDLPEDVLLVIYKFCDEKSKICLSQSCPEMYNTFAYKIWEEDLIQKFGDDWNGIFEEAYHTDDIDTVAKTMNLQCHNFLDEAIIYRLLLGTEWDYPCSHNRAV